MPTVTLFGSSAPRRGTADYQRAYDVGAGLAGNGFVVCNGGFGGTMEASARGAKEAGGTTIGVTVDAFRRPANEWIDREIRAQTLLERLAKLVELGDAYVVFPGSTGTLLELAAVWELVNKGIMNEKPILVFEPFWKPLVEQMRRASITEGARDCSAPLTLVHSPAECAEVLRARLAGPR